MSYICSRYYRAPELIFGATDYTTNIDVWSAGCVFAELMLGQPIFPGDSGVDQLVEIIKVLGTPTREQIKEMNPNYTEFKFPQIKAHPWQKVFRARTSPEAIDLGGFDNKLCNSRFRKIYNLYLLICVRETLIISFIHNYIQYQDCWNTHRLLESHHYKPALIHFLMNWENLEQNYPMVEKCLHYSTLQRQN